MFKLSPTGVTTLIKKSIYESDKLTKKEKLHITSILDLFFDDYSFDEYLNDFDLFFEYQYNKSLSKEDKKEFDKDLYRIYNKHFKNNVVASFEDVK